MNLREFVYGTENFRSCHCCKGPVAVIDHDACRMSAKENDGLGEANLYDLVASGVTVRLQSSKLSRNV